MTTAVLRRKSTRIIVKNVLIKSQHESHAGFFWFNAPEGKFHVMSMEEPSSTFAKIKKRRQNFNFFLKMSNKAGDWRRCFSSHYSFIESTSRFNFCKNRCASKQPSTVHSATNLEGNPHESSPTHSFPLINKLVLFMLFATLQTKINTLGITDIFFLLLKVERVNGKRIEFVSHRKISLIAILSTVMFLNSLAGRWPSDRVLRSGDNS